MGGSRSTRIPRLTILAGAIPNALARLALATIMGAGVLLATPLGAAATTTTNCESPYIAESGRQLFKPQARYIPPPLRGFPADCASRLTAAAGDDENAASADFSLIYTDSDFSEFVAMLRAFENAGWIVGAAVSTMSDGEDRQDSQALSSVDLEALDFVPSFAHGRFGNQLTGRNIISLTYYDGEVFDYSGVFTAPAILVELNISESFDTTSIADPSVFSGLRTIADALPDPAQAAVIAAGAVILMLVVGLAVRRLRRARGGRVGGQLVARRQAPAEAHPAGGAARRDHDRLSARDIR